MSILYKSFVFIYVLLISSLALSQTEQNVRTDIFHDSWPDSRFKLGNNGTVTDLVTDLMWKQCPEGANWSDNVCETEPDIVNWAEAHNMALESEYAGYTDWRVPNIKELASLTAHGRIFPAMHLGAFPLNMIGNQQGTPNYLSSTRTSEWDNELGTFVTKSVYYWAGSNGSVVKRPITLDPSDYKLRLLLVREK